MPSIHDHPVLVNLPGQDLAWELAAGIASATETRDDDVLKIAVQTVRDASHLELEAAVMEMLTMVVGLLSAFTALDTRDLTVREMFDVWSQARIRTEGIG